jgi:hypothetical protein
MLIGIPGTGLIGIGYTIVAYRYGQVLNKIGATILTFWQFANVILQVIVLFLLLPLENPSGHALNPSDIPF